MQRKNLTKTINVFIILNLLWVYPLQAEAEQGRLVADHLEQAISYEEKIAQLDIEIASHLKMKKEYRFTYGTNEKIHWTGRIEEMEKHCDAVIKAAEKLKRSYSEFVKWHRIQATKLQSK